MSVIFIVIKVNTFTLLTFFTPFFQVPFDSATLNIIDKHSASQSRTEYIILKEIALNAGRLTGVVAFILLLARSYTHSSLQLFLLIIGSIQLIIILFKKSLDFDTNVVKDQG